MINRLTFGLGTSVVAIALAAPAWAGESDAARFAKPIVKTSKVQVTESTFIPTGGTVRDAGRFATRVHDDASDDIMDPRFKAVDGKGSLKDGGAAPAAAGGRELTRSFNVGITSDYIFRGISQSAGRPTGQAGFDITYGLIYAGMWGSGIDFGREGTSNVAGAEVDLYFGIKPKWHTITFDLGAIYYAYPGARDNRTTIDGELDYFEVKAGMNTPLWRGASITSNYFYSPDYTNDTGGVFTSETTLSQDLPKFSIFTPNISALYGNQMGKGARFGQIVTNGTRGYSYWNAGLTLNAEKYSFDFRYWDTNIKNDNSANGFASNFCKAATFRCDARYVATMKFTY